MKRTVYPSHIVVWLREQYPEKGPTQCADELGSPYTAKMLRSWANRHGVRWIRTGKPRTHDQAAVMRKLWQDGKIVAPSHEENQRRGKLFSQNLADGRITHPRGMLGKPQTARCKQASRDRAVALVKEGKHQFQRPRTVDQLQRHSALMVNRLKTPGAIYSNAKRGYREDLGHIFFRSRWEANYARVLNFLIEHNQIAAWEYEPETFWFESIRRGVRSYTPDFKITGVDGSVWYEEVKGFMDAKSKTKLKRMKKYHPHVAIKVIGSKEYTVLEKQLAKAIKHWEFKDS